MDNKPGTPKKVVTPIVTKLIGKKTPTLARKTLMPYKSPKAKTIFFNSVPSLFFKYITNKLYDFFINLFGYLFTVF